jgi:ubiquinone/menaquinone biosynthesis C-methylase UbiE
VGQEEESRFIVQQLVCRASSASRKPSFRERGKKVSYFSEISKKYEKDSIVQRSASEILLDMLDIQPDDNVLDLGCGTGHITRLIREKTSGKVTGVDPSEGMIEQAKANYGDLGISFRKCSAERLDYINEFAIIFCNSAFQWFADPAQALRACYNSLKNGGKMAIQAPATDNYCPNFLEAIDAIKRDKSTRDIYAGFRSPWVFRNTAKEYQALFEDAGFIVKKSSIDKIATTHTTEEAYKIFESGAAAGYLNQDYYCTPISQEYTEAFRGIIKKSFDSQADKTGRIELTFYRIYLLARKSSGQAENRT